MFTADLHIHSKYSRATSRDLVPEMLDFWARRKGLSLIGTGDFTHPAWREELKQKLSPAEDGLYVLKDEYRIRDDGAFDSAHKKTRFLFTGEISSIYKKNGRVRKVHNLILLPGPEEAEELSRRLEAIGNLHSDGRPILGLDSRDLLEITLETCPEAVFIPAHIWTPHFSLFGAYSGFDAIEECFEDLTPHIHALETGLSSDPPMNWRLSALDRFTLVSNSDAHSPSKLAREANLFDTELSYSTIAKALNDPKSPGFCGTLEFFPEEGKYHYDGHRSCKVCLNPTETIAAAGICPLCGRRITVGVLHRVEELADRPEGYLPDEPAHFESLVPLPEVLASTMGVSAASKKVTSRYEELLHTMGSELYILREAPLEEIRRQAGPCAEEGIRKLRAGEVNAVPGYDGEYGKIQLLTQDEIDRLAGQLDFWAIAGGPPKDTPKSKARNSLETAAALLTEAGAEVGAALGARVSEIVEAADTAPSFGLNSNQWLAASSISLATAVIAGPGTGKTKTLIAHIAWLVESGRAKPGQITAVTFTNRAASEMRSRLKEHFAGKRTANSVNIGTFHGICLKLLSQWRETVTIIDEFDAQRIAAEVAEEFDWALAPRKLLQRISARKNGISADLPDEIFDEYVSRLKKMDVLDYDDILLETALHLEKLSSQEPDDPTDCKTDRKQKEKELKTLMAPFRHLLVDEFQDSNPLQYRLLRLWSRTAEELFVIGDPDQAIYGFRGSDSQCFERFFKDHPQAQKIVLTENYRSTPEILSCALPVLPPLPGAETRILHPNRTSKRKVFLRTAENAFSEALYLVKEINRLVGGVDMLDTHTTAAAKHGKNRQTSGQAINGLSDIAILYRTHRQAALLEDCLKQEGIPYVVFGRDRFLTDPNVRQALAFLRLLQNPGDPISQQACPDSKEMISEFQPLMAKEKLWKLVDLWIQKNRLANEPAMEQLRSMAVLYDTLADFLQAAAMGRESDVMRSGTRSRPSDAVTLMTLHGSKGLEFPVVYVCGVNEGLIPSRFSKEDWSEERRLFYVAMTRAKDQLTLLTCGEPSPFLAELPSAFLEEGPVRQPDTDGKQLCFLSQ